MIPGGLAIGIAVFAVLMMTSIHHIDEGYVGVYHRVRKTGGIHNTVSGRCSPYENLQSGIPSDGAPYNFCQKCSSEFFSAAGNQSEAVIKNITVYREWKPSSAFL